MLTDREIQILESCHFPNTYWKDKSEMYFYWMRALYERLVSSLDFTIPEDWSPEFFYLILFAFGYMPIFKTEKYGVTFQPATPYGYNWFYEPKYMRVVHTDLYNKKLVIGKDCEVLRLTSDYHGIFDVLDHFATLLSEASQSLKVQLINAKMPIILTADNASAAETLKQVYDKLKMGESLIVYDQPTKFLSEEIMPTGDEPFQSFINDLNKNYIGTELLDNINTILNLFYTECGLPTQSSEHGKSHTLAIEAEQAEEQSEARLDTWLKYLNASIKKINNMFDIGMEVKKHVDSKNDAHGDAGLSS